MISQQVLHLDELPSLLPPLHIPPHHHHEAPIAEEGGAAAASAAVAAGASPSTAQLSALSPFTAAAQLQQAPQQPGDGGGGGAAGRPRVLRQSSAASSTQFYQGTPRGYAARQSRSKWLRERVLGHSFMQGVWLGSVVQLCVQSVQGVQGVLHSEVLLLSFSTSSHLPTTFPAAVRQQGMDLAVGISHMAELALFARFEWLPLRRPHRMNHRVGRGEGRGRVVGGAL